MKCDELEPIEFADDFVNGNVVQYYDKHDVDEAVAELKEKLRLAEMAKDDAESANTEYREDINKLKSENERLVKCCKEYDSRQRIYERIEFNAAKQLRATKRALWMARALSAKHVATFCYYIAHYGRLNKVKKIYQCQDKWDKVEQLCIKKAEEYK